MHPTEKNLLNVVVCESAAIFELFSSEDKTLLIRRNSFLILDLLLHGVYRVGGIDIQGDGLTRKGFNEDLHRHLERMISTRNK